MALYRFAFAGMAAAALFANTAVSNAAQPVYRSGPANPFLMTITSIAPGYMLPGTKVTVTYKIQLLSAIPCDAGTNAIFLTIDRYSLTASKTISSTAGRPEVGVPATGGLTFTAPGVGKHTLTLSFTGDYPPGCVNPNQPPVPAALAGLAVYTGGPFYAWAEQTFYVQNPGGTIRLSTPKPAPSPTPTPRGTAPPTVPPTPPM